MHYSARAFTRNGRPTIEPTDSDVSLDALGQRTGFSTNDLQHVNALYCQESEFTLSVHRQHTCAHICKSMA